jgi:hypothetical protein
LQELIKQDNHEASHDQLDDQQDANTGAQIARLAIETGKDVDAALAEGEDNSEQFLGGLVELAVGFKVKVDVDEVGSGKELEGENEPQSLTAVSRGGGLPGRPFRRR